MHPEAMKWVEDAVVGHTFSRVIELGSRDVNGGVRHLFGDATFIGVDIGEGPGVDVVCDAADYLPDEPADCVVSTEMLEHTPRARETVLAAFEMLVPGGMLVMTAAGPGRQPHSAIDGLTVRSGEFYENVHPNALTGWLVEAGFERCVVDQRRSPADVRCIAYRPDTSALTEV